MNRTDSPDFVHLHVHTQYSLLDGAIRIDPLLAKAKEFEMHSVAITDHGTMFGVVDFYQKALKVGIKPIIGCECYIAPRSLNDKTPMDAKGLTHILLLAETQEGYHNLCQLATIAQLKGFYYKPRIDKELLRKHSKGLIALSACLHGEIPRRIKEGRMDKAEEAALFYQDLFGEGNFYLEVQNNGIAVQNTVNEVMVELSKKLSIPLAASNDCHYLNKNDVRAHDVLLCIQTGKTVHHTDRFKFSTDQLYFKSKEEMADHFENYPAALDNTVDIAKRCHVEFDFNSYHFPKFESKSDLPVSELFVKKTREGFAIRLRKIKERNPNIDESEYWRRLDFEVGVINNMGFAGYFLIVSDFIKYAKNNAIPVGPGRGSAAGSLVAYSLDITDLDPLEHGLIFERFLNPSRISMPDIDVDFCINGREQVFKYVVDRYGGGDYVAQIITFGKLKTRAVIRDVGRALDIPLHEVDSIAKLVPDVLNITLDEALQREPKLSSLINSKSQYTELIDICRVLEGLPRHASTHAAGVVIGDKPLVDYLPLYRGKKGEVVTQLDMKLVEKIGLVKFDFLGLRNLTVIAKTLSIIEQQGNTPPDLTTLDLNDAKTYRLLSAGDTTGVFQLESSGMKDLLVRLKPECFDDVIALVALYRPGPLDSGMVDDFVERKHGRKSVEFLVPDLEPILKETYGVIVYQEQVMKIAGELASYTMADADGLRKAMGKKIVEMMAQHRKGFIKGCLSNGIKESKAATIFDLMEKFGGYGFNKSHSAAYALIAFQTAFLKAHYPVEFIAALLTSEMHSIDGVVKYISECRGHRIEVLPPDINESVVEFTVDEGKIRFGLVAVKNVGESAIEAIIEERDNNGRFPTLYNFCERVDLRRVNKRVVESLIKCGAFDSTGMYRSQMMAALEDALEYGQRIQKERSDPQMGLFSFSSDQKISINEPVIPRIEEWDEKQRLSFEKESLGFYISGHPLDRYLDIIEKFANANTLNIADIEDNRCIRIGGMVNSTKVIRTKREELMAFVTFEDVHGSIELVVFPSLYTSVSELLDQDIPIFVQGEVKKEEKSVKLLANNIISIDRAEEQWVASVHIKIDVAERDQQILKELYNILRKYPGSCSAYLHLFFPENVETVIELSEEYKLRSCAELIREVNGLIGKNTIETKCGILTIPGNHQSFNGNNRKGILRHG